MSDAVHRVDAGLHARNGHRMAIIGVALGLPLSALFLWLAVRNADIDAVGVAIGDAQVGWVALAAMAMGGVYVFQAVRWRLIAATPWLSRLRFLGYVVAGIACNNVLPGRLGELFRARWLSVDAGIPGGRALGSVVLDRGTDLATLAVMLLLSAWLTADEVWLRRIAVAALLLLLVLSAVLAFARLYTRRRARARRMQRGFARRFARDTLEGLAVPLTPLGVGQVAILSICAWLCWAVGAWAVARSLGIELTAMEALFVTAAVNLGVVIPSSPGFVGTYQWLGVTALAVFGISTEPALAFSILLQAVWYVPTTLVGGVLLGARAANRLRRASPRQSIVS
jgi:uncharacterized protein (TIRG00374 family)